MYRLVLGDVFPELANEAKKIDPNAYLITNENYSHASGVVYTSVADMKELQLFLQVCQNAQEIFYFPPARWSDENKNKESKQKYWTELYLQYISQFVLVHNLPTFKKQFLSDSFLADSRQTEDKQLWVVGSSITAGIGVDTCDTWKEHVSKKFNLPYSDLSTVGGSITWASDQICRSDIRKNDLVFWQCIVQNRLPVIFNKKLIHLMASSFDQPSIKKHFNIDILDNDTLFYNNVLAVRRAYNFCNKIGAKLVILGLSLDLEGIYFYNNVPCFRQIRCYPDHEHLDLGFDNLHPGPLEHKKMANEFEKFYLEMYGKTYVS